MNYDAYLLPDPCYWPEWDDVQELDPDAASLYQTCPDEETEGQE